MNFAGWFGSPAAQSLLRLIANKSFSMWTTKSSVSNWTPRLNAFFAGKVSVYCQISRQPLIEIDGPYPLTETQKRAAVIERRRVKSEGRPNDLHAILINEPHWVSDPPHLRVQVLDFAAVRALRNEGLKPQVLSASVVIACPDNREVLLHHRERESDTFPESIHTVGGAYIPPGEGGVDADRFSLRSAGVREVHEETQLALSGDAFPPMMMAKEVDTGFIQLVFLGFGVKPAALSNLDGNWEGKPLRISYDELPGILQPRNSRSQEWVPTGKAHILAWLALGAPNAGRNPRFGGRSPLELFNEVVK